MKQIYTLLILICILSASASNISTNWYFGKNAGLSFNTSDGYPVILEDGQLNSYEGCAAISDKNGDLLFYTNSDNIWNKNHEVMKYGKKIGNSSTTMVGIVPLPMSDSIYYVLTVDYAGNYGEPHGFCCIKVDMSLNDGIGGIVVDTVDEKHYFQDTIAHQFFTEKIAITKHGNGRDYWIVIHEAGNDVFRAYLLNKNGIDSHFVESKIGSIHRFTDKDRTDAIGYMKISQQGDKLALVKNEDIYLELFDFDPFTGKLSNANSFSIPSTDDAYTVYGVEFSPDGSKLYSSIYKVFWISDPEKPREGYSEIYQWDLSDMHPDSIRKSKHLVNKYVNSEKDFGTFKALQLGPDKRIYVARTDISNLAVIQKPDEKGDSCKFINKGFYLEKALSYSGLPNLISGMVFPLPRLKYDSIVYIEANNCNGSMINKELKFINTGSGNIYFDFDSVKFDSDKFKIIGIEGKTILRPLDSLSIFVSFSPDYDDSGIFRDTFYLRHTDSLYLPENPISVEIIVDLHKIQTTIYDETKTKFIDTLDFGIVALNDNITKSFFVKNNSNVDINIYEILLKPKNFDFALYDPTIVPNAFGKIDITFQPNEIGNFESILFIYSEECAFPIDTLVIKGIAGDNFYLSTNDIDFGVLYQCEKGKEDVLFKNISTKDINITNIYLKNNNESFDIPFYNFPIKIEPDDEFNIPVKFLPKKKGEVSTDVLVIETDMINSDDIEINLKGEIDIFDIEFTNSINLGETTIGNYLEQEIELINNGKLLRKFTKIEASGVLEFEITDSILYPGIPFKIKFLMQSPDTGTKYGSIKIYFDDPCFDEIDFYAYGHFIETIVVTPKSVDFEDVGFCRYYSEYIIVENNGNTDIQIDNAYLLNAEFFNMSQFIQYPIILKPSENYGFRISTMYENGEVGKNDDLFILEYSYSGNDKLIKIPITANKILNEYSIDSELVFEDTEIGDTLSKELTINNLSATPLYINDFTLEDGFFINDELIGTEIGANQEFSFLVSFIPTENKFYNENIEIDISDSKCSKESTITLKGNSSKKLSIYIKNKSGKVGQKDFKLPVYAKILTENSSADDIYYSFDMVLRSDFFFINSISNGARIDYVDVNENLQNVTISGNINKLSNDEKLLFELTGTLLLSEKDTSMVTFDDLFFTDLNPEATEGFIFTDGICAQDISQVNIFEVPDMKVDQEGQIIHIEIDGNTSEEAEIEIYDILGNKVYSNILVQNSLINEINIKNNFSTGTYLFVLKTNYGIQTKKKLLLK